MFHEELHSHHSHSIKGGRCHLVAVNMGYGHERPAFALRHLASGDKIIVANDYQGIPDSDRSMWRSGQLLYEMVSRLKPVPVLGGLLFNFMDWIQSIPPFYPRRDLSGPSMQLKQTYRLIHKGLGKHLIETLAKNPLPLLCTFFLPAFAAEEHGYPGEIYLLCTDADISRAWAPLDPQRSKIRYFAPTGRVLERLQLYGVRRDHIYFTGFPMSKSLIGGPAATVIRDDLKVRLRNLDPQKVFYNAHKETIEKSFGKDFHIKKSLRPLTVAFAVGGAGAQKKLGLEIVSSLIKRIKSREIKFILVAGARKEVRDYFISGIKQLGLLKELGRGVEVLYEETRSGYFSTFEKTLRRTDILWTKPSELSFYAGLGMPIIIAPTVGSQEEFNKMWLTQVGAGSTQFDPAYTNEWLFDWVESGVFARMAWNGFIEAPTHGVYRIEDIIAGRPTELSDLPMIV